jgi:hypothetical protein
MLRVKRFTIAATFATLAMAGTMAHAAMVNIDSVTGVWVDVDPDDTVGIEGLGTSRVAWGTPVSGQKSAYDFAPNAPLTDVVSPFIIGTFTHENFTIAGLPDPSSITGATLEVVVNGSVMNGVSAPFSVVGTFVFAHDETTNTSSLAGCDAAKQESDVPCDDVVTFVSESSTVDEVIVGDTKYIFTLEGFVVDGVPVSEIKTVEGLENEADLWMRFETESISLIPVPAPLALVGLGLVGLIGVQRRLSRRSTSR